MPRQTTRWTDEHTSRARTLATEGRTVGQIARALGFSKSTVSRRCKDAGIGGFDRGQTLPALVAHQVSAHERLVEAQVKLSLLINKEIERVAGGMSGAYQTLIKTQGGGQEIMTLPFVPSEDLERVVRSADRLLQTSLKQQQLEGQREEARERSLGLLAALTGALDASGDSEADLYGSESGGAP